MQNYEILTIFAAMLRSSCVCDIENIRKETFFDLRFYK